MPTHDNGRYLLVGFDDWIRKSFVAKLPDWITTELLTLSTLLWCIAAIIVAFLAAKDFRLIYLIGVIVIIQHFTDVLDGAVGRFRHSGWVNWGYYMDHLMDFIFVSSLIFSYYIILPRDNLYLLLGIYAVTSALMIHAFLLTAVKENFSFHYEGIGTTEIKVLLALMNLAAAYFGMKFFRVSLELALVLMSGMLVRIVYTTQLELRALDEKLKSGQSYLSKQL